MYARLCQKREKWPSQCRPRPFLQPVKAAAMHTAPLVETCPPPPNPPFLLAQNLSPIRIAPTNTYTMRPKLYDTIMGFFEHIHQVRGTISKKNTDSLTRGINYYLNHLLVWSYTLPAVCEKIVKVVVKGPLNIFSCRAPHCQI